MWQSNHMRRAKFAVTTVSKTTTLPYLSKETPKQDFAENSERSPPGHLTHRPLRIRVTWRNRRFFEGTAGIMGVGMAHSRGAKRESCPRQADPDVGEEATYGS